MEIRDTEQERTRRAIRPVWVVTVSVIVVLVVVRAVALFNGYKFRQNNQAPNPPLVTTPGPAK